MDVAIVCALITSGATVVVAIITAVSNAKAKKEKKEFSQKEEEQCKERLLTMELLSANCKLSTVTAKAMFNHKTNGDVQDAFDSVKEAQEKYFDFINGIAARKLSKKS